MQINPTQTVAGIENQVNAEATQQFIPQFNKLQTRSLANAYKANPNLYSQQQVESIKMHSQYHQVPFYEGDFSFGEAIMQFGKGFASGFTTLETGDHPDNEYENIARSLGHLAGFAPGIMATPLKAFGLTGLASKVAKVKSVPLYLSEKITKRASKVVGPALDTAAKGRAGATQVAADFLTKGPVKHISEGAFNLGVASGISAWQGGVDAVMHSAFHGAIFGGVFRGLGNVINTGDVKADKVARAIAGSVFQGLPATMRGATSAEQVYEYLLGAYFGGNERPWYKQRSAEFMKSFQKELPNNAELEYTLRPELMGKKWSNLEPEVKTQVEKDIFKTFGSTEQRAERAYDLIEALEAYGYKLKDKITGEVTPESFKKLKEIETEVLTRKKEQKTEVTEEGVKVEPAVDRITEKLKQIDIDIAENQKKLSTLQKQFDKEERILKETGEETIGYTYASDQIAKLTNQAITNNKIREEIIAATKGIKLNKVSKETEVEDSNDIDVGMSTSEPIVGHRALQFAEKYLSKSWKLDDLPYSLQADLKTVISKELSGILSKYIKPGKTVETEKLAEELQKRFKTPLNEEARGNLRQWITRANKGIQTNFVRINYVPKTYDPESGTTTPAKAFVQSMDVSRPMTVSGVRKKNVEPIKIIEEVFLKEGGSPDKELGQLVFVDHISTKSKTGQFKDMKLSDLRRDNMDAYNMVMQNIVEFMKKKNFYLFGGRGDADKLIFVKHHPMVNKASKLQPTLRSLLSSKRELYREAKEEFKKQYPKLKNAGKEFDKGFLSNVLYDMGMNGFTYTGSNLRKLWSKGYLDNALAYNKRLQILFTPSWSGSQKFANAQLASDKIFTQPLKNSKGKDIKGTENTFKYIVIKDIDDLAPHGEKLLEFEAKLYNEIVDGAIIGTNKAIDYNNKDAGHVSSGQNKAFIVSPDANLGALYGKFMFHKAGDKLSNFMEKNGIHYIIHESSAKQIGGRKIGSYTLNKKELSLNSPVYSLNPSHIKYNYSVKNNNNMVKHLARIPKQMFSALSSRTAYKPIPNEIIEDVFSETIYKSYIGEKKWNDALTDYMANPTTSKEAKLLNNIEKIGINKLLEVVNSSEGSSFADAAYQRLLKLNKEIAVSEAKENGTKEDDLSEYMQEIDDFNTITDRLIDVGVSIAKKKDVQTSPIYAHKWIRPFRVAVMKNYILSHIAKPKAGNSAAARMRPYDKALMIDLDNVNPNLVLLQKRDDIFFLDNRYKKMPLETHLEVKGEDGKPIKTLGELWNYAKDPSKRKGLEKELQEIFRAMLIRVPMDSVSGAQILEFGGFTGRDGHGVLVHPRAMRAMGGADLDGDEAFIYFGGKDAAGNGKGMKKSWKDAFAANKEEYVQYVSKNKINGEYKYLTREEYDNLGMPKTKIADTGISVMRGSKYGNPFVIPEVYDNSPSYYKRQGFIRAESIPDAINRYEAWLRGTGDVGFLPTKRDAILKDLKSGKLQGKTLKYTVKRKGVRAKDNHAERLVKLIDEMAPKRKASKEQDKYAKYIPDNKKGMVNRPDGLHANMTMEDLLTLGQESYAKKAAKEQVWMYAPSVRRTISERVVDARSQLGGIVGMTQTMKGAHDLISSGKKGVDTFKFIDYNQKDNPEYTITIKARNEKEWLDYARRLSASMTAFGSDPMDTGGLKKYNDYFKELHSSYFAIDKVTDSKGKVVAKNADQFYKLFKADKNQSDPIWKLRGGLVKNYMEMNSALYGKNYKEGKMWQESEIRSKIDFIKDYADSDIHNIQGKQAKLLKATGKWSDNILNKIDLDKLTELYSKMNVINKENNWLADVMGRATFTIPQNIYVKKALDKTYKAYIEGKEYDYKNERWVGREAIANDAVKFNAFMKGLGYKRHKDDTPEQFNKDLAEGKISVKEKKEILDEIIVRAEDFILTNDMHDMVSLDLITSYINKNKGIFTNDVIKRIHKAADEIKNNSYLMAKERLDLERHYSKEEAASKDVEIAELGEAVSELQKEAGAKPVEGEISAKMDQLATDNAISNYKKTLKTAQERRLFDYFLLGSYNRQEKSKEIAIKNNNLKHWYSNAGANTSMTKLGFASDAVARGSIAQFLRKYSELTSSAFKETKKVIDDRIETAKTLDKKTIEFEGKEVPLIEDNLVEIEQYEGAVKGKLPKEDIKVIHELAENLHYYHNKEGINLNEITRYYFKKNLVEMNKQDYIAMNNLFKDFRSGSLWQKLFAEDAPDMKGRYWMLFPKSITREMMKYDILWLKEEGYFKEKGELKKGTVRKPTWWLDTIQDWIGKMGEKSTELGESLTNKINAELSFYVENVTGGELLRKYAVRKMQRPLRYKVLGQNKHKSRPERVAKSSQYERDYQEILKDKDLQLALSKTYSITSPEGVREKLTGEQIADRIIDVYAKSNEKVFEVIAGKPEALKKYETGETYDLEGLEPKIKWQEFISDMTKLYKQGKPIPTDFGIDGLRQVARSMMIDLLPRNPKTNKILPQYKVVMDKLAKTTLRKTEPIEFNTYFPHMFHSRKEAFKAMERQLEAISKDGTLNKTDKKEEMKKLMYRTHNLTGDWLEPGQEIFDAYDRAAQEILEQKKISQESIKWWDANQKLGNAMSREVHMPGYSIEHPSYEVYLRNVSNTYFNQMNQIFTRSIIQQFNKRAVKKGWHKEKFGDGSKFTLLQKWENFLKLYAQDAMGNPSIIPERIYEDPGMKLKGTPYYWWADNRVKKKLETIKDKLIQDKTKYPNLNKLMKEVPYQMLTRISNMEAKFELASLLAHPKSAVGNVFGGSLHTIQSAGLNNWKQGMDLNYLKRIDPEIFKTKDDINRFIVKHGVVPDFMRHEWGINPEVRAQGKQEFMNDVIKNMTSEGKIGRRELADLMDKHKLSKSLMQVASQFMSKPEMMLRRHAFMAHYVQAWKRFDGAIENVDHPFLIEQAKKGVQATQFLYSAPYRPAFARTALGKIMTRFQLWQWNAVRFRNDVRREAKIFGLKEGTPAFEKFKRTLQLDLLVFALGNVFMYSIFETALPAPWSWIQDTADWIFGNDKERDRAFMGTWPKSVAPLQVITPPIFRLPLAGIDSFIADDWNRFANYHIYTMAPFGRIIKDFSPWAKNNLIENPMMLIDKFSGFPMYGISRMAKDVRKEGVYQP